MQKALRLIMVALLGAFELVLLVSLILNYNQQVGEYGFTVGSDGVTIAAVQPQLPAALAGIKPGDHLVYQTLPLIGRRILTLKEPVPAETPLTLQLIHAGQMETLTLHAQTVPGVFIQIEALTYALAGFVFGAIGLILILLRPSWMTWGFAFIAPPMLLPWSLIFWAQRSDSLAAASVDLGISLFYALQGTGMMVFASRFPHDKPRGLALLIDRLSIPVGLIIAAIYIYVCLTVRYTTQVLLNWETISDCAILIPSLAALVALIANYLTTPGSDRSRLVPVIGSFILLIAVGTLQQLSLDLTSSPDLLFAANLANACMPTLVAVAVAYGIICHRVMGVSFIIERTLVYTMLTVLVVVIFSIIEYFVGKLLERGRLTELIEMAAAVGIALSINYIHTKLDDFMDKLFFRRRYAAARRLRRTAQTLPHAATLALIDEMLVVEPSEALDLASAAVFRLQGKAYQRVEAKGWEEQTATRLELDDHLVVRLRAELQVINLAEVRWPCSALPKGYARPLYALPVLIGHQLEAILLYGGHSGGEDLDPDERKNLRNLALAAAMAYGRIHLQQLNTKLEDLKVENQTLLEIEKKLTSLLESRLGNSSLPPGSSE